MNQITRIKLDKYCRIINEKLIGYNLTIIYDEELIIIDYNSIFATCHDKWKLLTLCGGYSYKMQDTFIRLIREILQYVLST